MKKFIVLVPSSKKSSDFSTIKLNKEPDTETRRSAGLYQYSGCNGLPTINSLRVIFNKMPLLQKYKRFYIYRAEASEYDELYVMISLYLQEAQIFDYDEMINFGLAAEGINCSCLGLVGRYRSVNTCTKVMVEDIDPEYFKKVVMWDFPEPINPKEE